MTKEMSFDEEFPADLAKEMARVFGATMDVEEGERFFVLLPLVSGPELLEFMRTVPSGTTWTDLVELASQYRAARP